MTMGIWCCAQLTNVRQVSISFSEKKRSPKNLLVSAATAATTPLPINRASIKDDIASEMPSPLLAHQSNLRSKSSANQLLLLF